MIILIVLGLFALAIIGVEPASPKAIQEAKNKQFAGRNSTSDNIGKTLLMILFK